MIEHAKAIRNWHETRQEQQLINKIRYEEKKTSAVEKKKHLLREHHAKAIHALIKWDEYRIKREAITVLYYQAVNQLAMKRAWVYIISIRDFYKKVYEKYREFYMEHCFQEFRKLACSKIKALWKLSMKRWNAQYKEEKQLEDKGTVYRFINRQLVPTRQNRRVR